MCAYFELYLRALQKSIGPLHCTAMDGPVFCVYCLWREGCDPVVDPHLNELELGLKIEPRVPSKALLTDSTGQLTVLQCYCCPTGIW